MSQVVGKIVDGTPTFTVNKTELTDVFNNNIQELTDLNLNFKTVEILDIDDEYFLVFLDEDKTARSALAITIEGGEVMFLNVQGGSTCTTVDCSSSAIGCYPRSIVKGCTPCSNNGKCTRTSSYTSLIQ